MKKCPNCNNSTMNIMKKCPTCGAPLDDACIVGFSAAFKAQVDDINQKKNAEKNAAKDRLEQLDHDGIAYCPKCHSASLSAHKKGFGIGKAVIGATIAPIGLVAGNIGAKKVRVTCLKCGHQFFAGKQ